MFVTSLQTICFSLFCVQRFQKMCGEEFLESVDAQGQPAPSVDRPETSESSSIVLEARGNLCVKEIQIHFKTNNKSVLNSITYFQ